MPNDPTLTRLERLTPKERACLLLVARRLSSKEIAAELGIAKTSVDTYCNRARAKLQVADRYEAARLVVAQEQARSAGPVATAAAPAEPELARAELVSRANVNWLFVAVGALVGVLALASLVAGMSALDEMKDPHPLEPSRRQASPTIPAPPGPGAHHA